MATTEKDLCDFIRSQVKAVCTTDPFTVWVNEESPQAGDMILINNSFIYRDRVETKKNPQYLALLIKDGEIRNSELAIATSGITADFRRFRSSSILPTAISLEDACHQELSALKRLVFILIGNLDDSVEFGQSINHSLFDCLLFRPNLSSNLVIDGKTILVKDVSDEELIWKLLNKAAVELDLVHESLPDSLVDPLQQAIMEIRKNCYVRLRFPEPHSSLDDTFLDSVIRAFKQSTHEYRESLEKWSSVTSDTQEYNNILRLAYNFADEAITILRLLVSVCDLKPILQWMTVKEQIELTEAFRNLPWARTSNKPSFGEYAKMIGGARNRAFHHLLPFEHTLQVQLEGIPIQAKTLRLFPEHSSSRTRSRGALDYEDRELVDIFSEFTRAEQRSVSQNFWERNLDVMAATINLLTATANSLKFLNDIG